MIRSSLCDYSDAYIVVEGTITVARVVAPAQPKMLAICALSNSVSDLRSKTKGFRFESGC